MPLTNNEKELLVSLLNDFAEEIHQHMTKQGFGLSSKLEDIALIHSEFSEGLENIRHRNPPSDHIPLFTGEQEEFADGFIRMLHYGKKHNVDWISAIFPKHSYNLTRPFKHGKTI